MFSVPSTLQRILLACTHSGSSKGTFKALHSMQIILDIILDIFLDIVLRTVCLQTSKKNVRTVEVMEGNREMLLTCKWLSVTPASALSYASARRLPRRGFSALAVFSLL